MDKHWKEKINNIENEFKRIVEDALQIKLESFGTDTGSLPDSPSVFKARIPLKNKSLINTNLVYKTSKKILHFTSLQVLYSIINERAVRMYNLNKSSDKKEYLYASNFLRNAYEIQGFGKLEIDTFFRNIKTYTFILSCTGLENLDDKFFWESYGNKGKGVAIEFEVLNNVLDWNFFYYAQVFYNQLKSFKQLKEKWIELIKKYPEHKFIAELDQVLALHKSHINNYPKEKEIRILAFLLNVNKDKIFNNLFRDFLINKPNQEILYFKLPLCNSNGKFINTSFKVNDYFFWDTLPKLRISNIFFGPNLPKSISFNHLAENLQTYISKKMDCNLPNLTQNQINSF